jgi:hypothetical protein
MWYFYGRKKKFVHSYQSPRHPLIIEPFAGSASYSLHGDNWRRKVILVERDPHLAALWRWLIKEATVQDLLDFPDPVLGEPTSELLHILHSASKRWWQYRNIKATPQLMSAWSANKKLMASCVPKVKHWEILEGDYTIAPDENATWFVDPPYQGNPGDGYRFGSSMLDYDALSGWVQSRQGQVIACEGKGATWLPFQSHAYLSAASGKFSHEVCWTNTPDDPSILDLLEA